MFHFPASTPTQTMHSSAGNTTQPVLGFPIRTSSDQRFVDNSPRHNAASHVLHRLSMPRHPPYALNNQTHYPTHTTHTTHHTKRQTACADTQNTYKRSCKHKKLQNTKYSTHTPPKQWSMERRKMLASTIQFSHNTPTPQQPHKPHDHHSAGQQDNHNHTNTVWLTVCCPRHPTACQHTKTTCLRKLGYHLSLLRSTSRTAGAHPPGFQNTFWWQSHTRRHQPPCPTTVGTTKQKAP